MADKKTETTKNDTSTTKTTTPKSSGGGQTAGIVVSVIVLLAIVGGIWYLTQMNPSGENEANQTENTEGYPETVATVNGEEIERKDFEERLREFSGNASQQGLDTTDESVMTDIEAQALTSLINTEILVQAAMDAGIEVSDEEIEAAYQQAVTNLGGEDVLQGALADLGFTEEELREDIAEQLMIDAYIQQETDYQNITVSDEELAEMYAELAAANPEVPPLEEIAEDFRAQQVQVRQQEVVGTFVEELRAAADIEIFIN